MTNAKDFDKWQKYAEITKSVTTQLRFLAEQDLIPDFFKDTISAYYKQYRIFIEVSAFTSSIDNEWHVSAHMKAENQVHNRNRHPSNLPRQALLKMEEKVREVFDMENIALNIQTIEQFGNKPREIISEFGKWNGRESFDQYFIKVDKGGVFYKRYYQNDREYDMRRSIFEKNKDLVENLAWVEKHAKASKNIRRKYHSKLKGKLMEYLGEENVPFFHKRYVAVVTKKGVQVRYSHDGVEGEYEPVTKIAISTIVDIIDAIDDALLTQKVASKHSHLKQMIIGCVKCKQTELSLRFPKTSEPVDEWDTAEFEWICINCLVDMHKEGVLSL